MILAIRTDQPQATLVLVEDGRQLESYSWQADRQLADTLLDQIEKLLARHQAGWAKLTGILVYQGPGSFTGLRIGATVANTVAYACEIPIVGSTSEDWLNKGLDALQTAKPGRQVLPQYGSEPNISQPKK